MERINDRAAFVAWARARGMRPDWHEPDEQGVTARVEGTPLDFDNCGYWPTDQGYARTWGNEPRSELHLILSEQSIEEGKAVRGQDLAAVNLADLCAWASEPHPEVEPCPPAASYDADRPHPGPTELFPVSLDGTPTLLGFNGLALTASARRPMPGVRLSAAVSDVRKPRYAPHSVMMIGIRWHCDGPSESQTGSTSVVLSPRGGPGLKHAWSWVQRGLYVTRKGAEKYGPVAITMQLSRAVLAAPLT